MLSREGMWDPAGDAPMAPFRADARGNISVLKRDRDADPEVQARLVPVLHSGDKHVKAALNKWRDVQPALAKQFKDELLTVDASGDVLALVEKLQDCFIVKA